MQSAIESYNDNEHRTLKTTPNNAWSNSKLQITKHLNDMIHNENIYKSIPFKPGENVRILEDKDMFSKGKNKFSTDTYKISDKIGYKISVVNDDENKLHCKFKPSEFLKINKIDKPISKSYIEEEKEDKKKGKIINSLIKNAKMTPIQAQQAVSEVNEPKARRSAVVQNYAALAGINRRKK